MLAPTCDLAQSLPLFAAPLQYTALIVDPKGEGRALDYTLSACADATDRDCSEAAERVELSSGTTTAGELRLSIRPGIAQLPDGTGLLQKVVEKDTYQGLGGVRVPLVLRVRAGEEEVFAQKLAVFGCKLFPEMTPNVEPVVPGLNVAGAPWGEAELKPLAGEGPFELTPDDFTALQEAYVVPSLQLQPVHLEERWRLGWYTTLGTISPNQTGGSNFAGEDGRHRVEWQPPKDAGEQDVTFWVIARDGRGGESWLVRRAHFVP